MQLLFVSFLSAIIVIQIIQYNSSISPIPVSTEIGSNREWKRKQNVKKVSQLLPCPIVRNALGIVKFFWPSKNIFLQKRSRTHKSRGGRQRNCIIERAC